MGCSGWTAEPCTKSRAVQTADRRSRSPALLPWGDRFPELLASDRFPELPHFGNRRLTATSRRPMVLAMGPERWGWSRRASATGGSPAKEPEPSSPIPGGLGVARALIRLESAGWLILGSALLVSGVMVLRGGGGVPGVIRLGDPGYAWAIGRLAVGVGAVLLALGIWGLWTSWSRRVATRAGYLSALLYSAVGLGLALWWIRLATTPIPGVVTLTINLAIWVGLVGSRSSRATIRRVPAEGAASPPGVPEMMGPRDRS